ncbi:MAG: hypothetical protein IMF08_13660, partial [Proteobacteria bacterium]|nr:hypothetical protein [Pseudomonadota bacterium]
RPLVLAAAFTVPGEAMLFVLWEISLYSDGNMVTRLIWAAIDAVAMIVAIGLMVGFVVGRRHEGVSAAVISSCCYAIVLFGGILICYKIDMEQQLFGVQYDPGFFIMTSVVPALLSAPLYGWLLHSDRGQGLLARAGL